MPRTTIRPPTSANDGLPPTFSSWSSSAPATGALTAGRGEAGGTSIGLILGAFQVLSRC